MKHGTINLRIFKKPEKEKRKQCFGCQANDAHTESFHQKMLCSSYIIEDNEFKMIYDSCNKQ